MNTDETRVILHLALNGKWTLKEMAECFQSLRYAYASIDVFLQEVARDNYPRRLYDRYPPAPPKRLLSRDWVFYRFIYPGWRAATGSAERPLSEYYHWHREYTLGHVWSEDDLLLEAIQMGSPGWADILGKLNPLVVIKDYIVLVRDWREERRRLALENQLLATKVLQERMAILREAGFSETEIKDFVNDHIRIPLDELRPYQEKGLIASAEIKQLPPP
jgi:hypothetical protein